MKIKTKKLKIAKKIILTGIIFLISSCGGGGGGGASNSGGGNQSYNLSDVTITFVNLSQESGNVYLDSSVRVTYPQGIDALTADSNDPIDLYVNTDSSASIASLGRVFNQAIDNKNSTVGNNFQQYNPLFASKLNEAKGYDNQRLAIQSNSVNYLNSSDIKNHVTKEKQKFEKAKLEALNLLDNYNNKQASNRKAQFTYRSGIFEVSFNYDTQSITTANDQIRSTEQTTTQEKLSVVKTYDNNIMYIQPVRMPKNAQITVATGLSSDTSGVTNAATALQQIQTDKTLSDGTSPPDDDTISVLDKNYIKIEGNDEFYIPGVLSTEFTTSQEFGDKVFIFDTDDENSNLAIEVPQGGTQADPNVTWLPLSDNLNPNTISRNTPIQQSIEINLDDDLYDEVISIAYGNNPNNQNSFENGFHGLKYIGLVILDPYQTNSDGVGYRLKPLGIEVFNGGGFDGNSQKNYFDHSCILSNASNLGLEAHSIFNQNETISVKTDMKKGDFDGDGDLELAVLVNYYKQNFSGTDGEDFVGSRDASSSSDVKTNLKFSVLHIVDISHTNFLDYNPTSISTIAGYYNKGFGVQDTNGDKLNDLITTKVIYSSDASALKTLATDTTSGWVLNGNTQCKDANLFLDYMANNSNQLIDTAISNGNSNVLVGYHSSNHDNFSTYGDIYITAGNFDYDSKDELALFYAPVQNGSTTKNKRPINMKILDDQEAGFVSLTDFIFVKDLYINSTNRNSNNSNEDVTIGINLEVVDIHNNGNLDIVLFENTIDFEKTQSPGLNLGAYMVPSITWIEVEKTLSDSSTNDVNLSIQVQKTLDLENTSPADWVNGQLVDSVLDSSITIQDMLVNYEILFNYAVLDIDRDTYPEFFIDGHILNHTIFATTNTITSFNQAINIANNEYAAVNVISLDQNNQRVSQTKTLTDVLWEYDNTTSAKVNFGLKNALVVNIGDINQDSYRDLILSNSHAKLSLRYENSILVMDLTTGLNPANTITNDFELKSIAVANLDRDSFVIKNITNEVISGSKNVSLASRRVARYGFSSAKLLAVVARPPCYEAYGQDLGNCNTSWSKSSYIANEEGRNFHLEGYVTAGLDFEISAGFLVSKKISSFSTSIKHGVSTDLNSSSNVALTKGIDYSTNGADDLVIASVNAVKRYYYEVVALSTDVDEVEKTEILNSVVFFEVPMYTKNIVYSRQIYNDSLFSNDEGNVEATDDVFGYDTTTPSALPYRRLNTSSGDYYLIDSNQNTITDPNAIYTDSNGIVLTEFLNFSEPQVMPVGEGISVTSSFSVDESSTREEAIGVITGFEFSACVAAACLGVGADTETSWNNAITLGGDTSIIGTVYGASNDKFVELTSILGGYGLFIEKKFYSNNGFFYVIGYYRTAF